MPKDPALFSLFYIQLKDPAMRTRLENRAKRLWPDLELSGTDTYANKASMVGLLRAYVVGIAGLAIILGAVGMMNAQLMSVIERTREIGVLRAVGWSRWRVLGMILGEVIVGKPGWGNLRSWAGTASAARYSLILSIIRKYGFPS